MSSYGLEAWQHLPLTPGTCTSFPKDLPSVIKTEALLCLCPWLRSFLQTLGEDWEDVVVLSYSPLRGPSPNLPVFTDPTSLGHR